MRRVPAAVVAFFSFFAMTGVRILPEAVAAETPQARVEPIAPDRPDFTDGVLIVERVQLEAGATQSRVGSREELSLGEVLLRVPMAERLELRLALAYIRDRDEGESASGLSNSFLGAKYQLRAPDDGRIGIAVLAGTTLPTGASRVAEPGGLQPVVKLALAKEFTERIGLGVNVGYAYEKDDGVRVDDFFASASLGISLTQNLGSFVEVWMLSKSNAAGDSARYASAGLTYLLSPDVMVDLRAGWGIGNDFGSPDYFAGAGLSVRF